MQVNHESIVYPDHVEAVEYAEAVFRVSPFITDSYIHIFNSFTINPKSNERFSFPAN
jgi:hypothetical protein